MSRHKTGYVILYHGILCHDMSYVMTIAASLIHTHACMHTKTHTYLVTQTYMHRLHTYKCTHAHRHTNTDTQTQTQM